MNDFESICMDAMGDILSMTSDTVGMGCDLVDCFPADAYRTAEINGRTYRVKVSVIVTAEK